MPTSPRPRRRRRRSTAERLNGVTVDVKVTTPNGTNPAPGLYTYRWCRRSRAWCRTPGPPSAGRPVTITGCGYIDVSQVSFGSTPAASFEVVDDSTISGVTPAHTGGTGHGVGDHAGRHLDSPRTTARRPTAPTTPTRRALDLPDQGEPLTPVTGSRGGFAPGRRSTSPTRPAWATRRASSSSRRPPTSGAFSCAATIPSVAYAGAPGAHTITAKGVTSGATATTTFTLAPPSWSQFRREPTHSGTNPNESLIGVGNVATLAQAWTGTTAGDVESSPAVANGVAYVGSDDHKLYAYDAVTGAPMWNARHRRQRHLLPGRGERGRLRRDLRQQASSPSTPSTGAPCCGRDHVARRVLPDGGRRRGLRGLRRRPSLRLRRRRRSTGCSGVPKVCTPLWSAPLGAQVHSSPPLPAAWSTSGPSTTSSTPSTQLDRGTPLWTATTAGGVDSSPTVASGLVYVGSADHKLYAFDAAGVRDARGTPRCAPRCGRRRTGSTISSSPAVAKGMVYVGSTDHKLYAFNASTGAALWTALTGGSITSSPAVANGVVYVGSADHKLSAYDAAGVTGCSGAPEGLHGAVERDHRRDRLLLACGVQRAWSTSAPSTSSSTRTRCHESSDAQSGSPRGRTMLPRPVQPNGQPSEGEGEFHHHLRSGTARGPVCRGYQAVIACTS